MKRSFLVKQLQSLKSQVESLLEASNATGTLDVGSSVKNAGEATKTISDSAADPKGFMVTLKEKWNDLMAWLDEYYQSAKIYLKDSAVGKKIIEIWGKIKDQLRPIKLQIEKVYGEMKDKAIADWTAIKDWHEAATWWQKGLLYVGILAVFAAIVYLASKVTNPKAMIMNAGQAALDSFKKSGEVIKDSFNYAKNGLTGVVKGLASIVAAPFKAIFAAAGSAMDEGLGNLLGLAALAIGSCAGVLYYRSRPKDPLRRARW